VDQRTADKTLKRLLVWDALRPGVVCLPTDQGNTRLAIS
jgi:hypothetical protein